jgi:hypothetical protein
MALTISTKTYNSDRVTPDAVTYVGPSNTLTTKDSIQLSRVYPKPVTGFLGVARPGAKIVRTVVTNATTGETRDAIVNLSGSIPVGIAPADLASMIADAVDLLQLEEAGTTKLFSTLDVTY